MFVEYAAVSAGVSPVRYACDPSQHRFVDEDGLA
jgi:hypothetical protein